MPAKWYVHWLDNEDYGHGELSVCRKNVHGWTSWGWDDPNEKIVLYNGDMVEDVNRDMFESIEKLEAGASLLCSYLNYSDDIDREFSRYVSEWESKYAQTLKQKRKKHAGVAKR